DSFTLDELRAAIALAQNQLGPAEAGGNPSPPAAILDLALSNHEVRFAPGLRMSERVLFPRTPSQSNGIEDARFVLFTHDDGSRSYFATYTAYDGRTTRPQLLETVDFLGFKFITLAGAA